MRLYFWLNELIDEGAGYDLWFLSGVTMEQRVTLPGQHNFPSFFSFLFVFFFTDLWIRHLKDDPTTTHHKSLWLLAIIM